MQVRPLLSPIILPSARTGRGCRDMHLLFGDHQATVLERKGSGKRELVFDCIILEQLQLGPSSRDSHDTGQCLSVGVAVTAFSLYTPGRGGVNPRGTHIPGSGPTPAPAPALCSPLDRFGNSRFTTPPHSHGRHPLPRTSRRTTEKKPVLGAPVWLCLPLFPLSVQTPSPAAPSAPRQMREAAAALPQGTQDSRGNWIQCFWGPGLWLYPM